MCFILYCTDVFLDICYKDPENVYAFVPEDVLLFIWVEPFKANFRSC